MSLLVEGERSVWLGCQAEIVQDDRELAWAEKYVERNEAYKWILGRYVAADEHNLNGHYFALEDLRQTGSTVRHSPLNMLHRPRHIVGTFVAAEMIYPTTAPAAAANEHPMYVARTPYMEALSAFWKYLCQDEYQLIERAWSEGQLYYSMEAVPPSVTCMADGGCGQTFKYMGRTHDSYCAHLNEHAAKKRLNQPHFVGGALVIPPSKPGWANADITELAGLIEGHAEQAEALYDAIAGDMPHLGPREWEGFMAQILVQAVESDEDARSRQMRMRKVKHAYTALGGDGGDKPNAPCKECGLGAQADCHTNTSGSGQPKEKAAKAPAASHRTCKSCGAHMSTDATKCQSCGAAWKAADVLEEFGPDVELSTYGDYPVTWELARDFSKQKRDELSKKKLAMSDGSYPIVTVGDLKNAIRAIGRAAAGKRAKVIAHIKKRAAALGRSDLVENLGK